MTASVSVVVPVRNRAGLVGAALDSVAAQTGSVLEVLVVDDGSTDDTKAVVEAWGKMHPDVSVRLVYQEHGGANAARNRGVAEARGDCVAFLDSDDRWWPRKLRLQLDRLERNPSALAVYCGCRNVDLGTGEPFPTEGRAYPEGDLLDRLLVRDVTAPTSCWLVRRSALEQAGGFDESLPARQDWDLWIRLAALGEILAVAEVLADIGEHEGERVRSVGAREMCAHRIIYEKYATLREQRPWHITPQARAALFRRRGRICFHRGHRFIRALGWQLLAICSWPFAFDAWAALIGMCLPARFRNWLHGVWNRRFGGTRFAIRSH